MNKQHSSFVIRRLQESDIPLIVDAFIHSNWTLKPKELFEKYLAEQNNNKRVPHPKKQIGKGLLNSILKQAKLKRE
jgi:hypothetical protein